MIDAKRLEGLLVEIDYIPGADKNITVITGKIWNVYEIRRANGMPYYQIHIGNKPDESPWNSLLHLCDSDGGIREIRAEIEGVMKVLYRHEMLMEMLRELKIKKYPNHRDFGEWFPENLPARTLPSLPSS